MNSVVARISGWGRRFPGFSQWEIAAFGTVAAGVLICLAGTQWRGYPMAPTELSAAARQAETQIVHGKWPDAERRRFDAVSHRQRVEEWLFSRLDVEPYHYPIPMSPRLYPRWEPIDEPVWLPVEDLIATPGRFALEMATVPRDVDPPRDGAMDAAKPPRLDDLEFGPRRPIGQPDSQIGVKPPGLPMANPRPDTVMNRRPEASESSIDGRGLRYVVLTGAVPLRAQIERVAQALHLDNAAQAVELLEYLDFTIERQAAVGGPDAWAGEWKRLDTQDALDVLDDSHGFDEDRVAPGFCHPVFTMPLPRRLHGYWGDRATHPRIAVLQRASEQRSHEAESVPAVNNPLGEIPGKFPVKPRQPRPLQKMPGAPALMPHEFQVLRPMIDTQSDTQLHAAAELLLFRCFDFAVEPGECYRYRVRLTLRNPNHGLPQGQTREPWIAAGETRDTPWSAASAPVAIENDHQYFLSKVPRPRGSLRPLAELTMFQWDPQVGTIIQAPLKMSCGQYVGGSTKALRLNLARPSFRIEEVRLSSSDLLVDTLSAACSFAAADHPRLEINSRRWKEFVEHGALDQIVTANPYGELIAHDRMSTLDDLRVAESRLANERKPWLKLLEEEGIAN